VKLNDKQIENFWDKLLHEYRVIDEIDHAAEDTDRNYIDIDYWTIEHFNEKFSDYVLDHPARALRVLEKMIKELTKRKLTVRIFKLPKTHQIKIRSIRSNHLGKLIAVQGLVRKTSEVRPEMKEGLFECLRCHAVMREYQETMDFHEPLECSKDDPNKYVGDPGCGRPSSSTSFKILLEESTFIDTQETEMQEPPEEMKGGEQPQKLTIYLHDDLAGSLNPGDRVIITGVIAGFQRLNRKSKSTIFDIHMKGIHIQSEERVYEDIQLTDEEIAKIKELAHSKDIYKKLIGSIAPSIYGLELVKESIALQMFGGVPKPNPDGTRIRGDIHILLIGDPGIAKSQMLKYVSGAAPRGIYASGKATTSAGLTAAARQDSSPMGQGRWILEAGALVLADNGVCCIDEIDKMSNDDRSSMHEAMEQQTISVHKAGIDATLNTRCAILAAANPQYGRFDPDGYKSITEQINLPPTLLSRFDVIFPLADKPHKIEDTMVSSHILRTQKGGEMKIQMKHTDELENGQKEIFKREDLEELLTVNEPVITVELLRKYIAYTRITCFPVMTDSAMEKIQKYYLTVRESSEKAIAITPRQLEALIRMSEASARIRIDPQIKDEDADRAIKIMKWYLERVASDNGVMDIDVVTTGVPHTIRGIINEVVDLIKVLSDGNHGVRVSELNSEANKRNIDPDKLQKALEQLKKKGRTYEPKDGYIRLIL